MKTCGENLSEIHLKFIKNISCEASYEKSTRFIYMPIARANEFLFLGFAHLKLAVCLINRNAVYALQSIKKRRKWGSCHVHICFISNVWINGSESYPAVLSANRNWRDEKARRRIENLGIFIFIFHCFCDFNVFLLARLLEWVYCL